MLQKRSLDKYHSAGLWTNTCCSHPLYGEDLQSAVSRRLEEEMGIETNTQYAFNFKYKAMLENGLIEHELDHVFVGIYNEEPTLNKEEVAEWKYMNFQEIEKDIRLKPSNYTEWFKLCFSDRTLYEKLFKAYTSLMENKVKYA